MNQAQVGQSVSLHFSLDGEWATKFFREKLFNKTSPYQIILEVQESFGMNPDQARQLLRGEKKLVGVNEFEWHDDMPDPDFLQTLCYTFAEEREVPGLFKKGELDEYWKNVPVPEKEPSWSELFNDLAEECTDHQLNMATAKRISEAAKHRELTSQEKSLQLLLEVGSRNSREAQTAPMLPPMSARNSTAIIAKPTMSVKDFMDDIKEADEFDPTPTDEPPEDVDPAQHAGHKTWYISPDGKFYKVPFQQHEAYTIKYAKFLGFDNYVEFRKHGWARCSGSSGSNLVFMDFYKEPPANFVAVKQLVMLLAANTFCSGDQFEMNYKEMLRYVNEVERGRFNG